MADNVNAEEREANGDETGSRRLQGSSKVPKEPHDHTRQHWKTPTFMVGSLGLGIAFALGHHFFYEYCNGREADHHLQQQWVTRAGTAFAFMVKMLLAISTGIAYIQQCWMSLRSRPQSVRRVDSMFSILSNILLFFDPGLWLRSPLLTFSAIVTWALPLAAIVTPGTITVNLTQQIAISPGIVPQLEYDFLQYASQGCDRSGGCTYSGPTNGLARIAISSATQGQIQAIPAPQSNASYAMSFLGPALSCHTVDSTNLTAIFNKNTSEDGGELQYLSWVPSAKYPSISNAPVKYGDGFDSVDVSWEDTTLDLLSTDGAKIFILGQTGFPNGAIEFNYTLLQCSLKNASYNVNFDFRYPSQTIRRASRHFLNDVPASKEVPNTMPGYGPDTFSPLSKPSLAYQAVMDAFGRVMVGQTATAYYQGIVSTSTLFPMTTLWSEILTMSTDGLETPDPAGNSTFAPLVEELFQNITLSLLSSAQFRANSSQSTPVLVTTEQYRELYVYQRVDLYIAYGLSILCALVCVVLGMSAIHHNGSTYSNEFSTVLRTTRAHEFDALVTTPIAAKGGNPLGARLASQVIMFEDDVGSIESRKQEFVGGFIPWDQPASQGLLSRRIKTRN